MSNVINIADHKPHLGGPAKCAGCGHEWHAVVPVGVVDELECPQCHSMKGLMVYGVVPEITWTCGCGCFVFTVSGVTRSVLCWNCGKPQEFA